MSWNSWGLCMRTLCPCKIYQNRVWDYRYLSCFSPLQIFCYVAMQNWHQEWWCERLIREDFLWHRNGSLIPTPCGHFLHTILRLPVSPSTCRSDFFSNSPHLSPVYLLQCFLLYVFLGFIQICRPFSRSLHWCGSSWPASIIILWTVLVLICNEWIL